MNLDQLRRQAKELRDAARRDEPEALRRVTAVAPAPDKAVSLSLAQLAIARENGFTSWPALKAAVDSDRAGLSRFLDLSVNGPARAAVGMLRAHPRLADDPYAAAALGDPPRAAHAAARSDSRGWSPLLYACYSRWHQFEPDRDAGLTATVTRLLDAGADPSSHNGRLPGQGYQSALHGAVVSNKPTVVALLIARGAIVDDRSSLPAAAELRHHECLDLLLVHGASIERTWALGAAVLARDAWAVRRLLVAVAATGGDAARLAGEQLDDAARDGSAAVIETLLGFGASATGRPELVREAVRAGSADAARLLEAAAGDAAVTVTDRLIGACMRGDRAEAQDLAASAASTATVLSDDDRAFLVHAAGRAPAATVELLLDAGWPVDARDESGETALHSAAYQGSAAAVALLLARGARVDARDSRFDSTPLTFATVGSRERGADADSTGDWAATVQLLLESGAAHDGVWLSGDKAPSDEVAAVLSRYGAVPTLPSQPDPAPEPDAAGVVTDTLTELAELLRLAFETTDLDLFASLLHPDVRWGGGPLGCTSREQVIAQYRQSAGLGFRGTVAVAESAGDDTLIIELRFAGAASGMPPGPAAQRAQVLRIVDELIVGIDGYPDLDSARAAVRA